MRPKYLVSFGCLLILPIAHAAAATLHVLGDRVNLRAAPMPESEVVGQVSKADALTAAGEISGDWVKVIAPDRVNFWVRRDLLRDGAAAVSKVHVRVGPGINYRVACTLAAGDRVTVRGESGEWTQIAPPAGATLWIHRRYVRGDQGLEPSAPPKPEPPVVEPPKPEPPAPVPPKPTFPVAEPPAGQEHQPAVPTAVPPFLRSVPQPPPEPPASVDAGAVAVGAPPPDVDVAGLPPKLVRRLAPLRKQGELGRYSGRLRPTGIMWRRPSRYRLVAPDATGRLQVVCYLVGDREQLGRVLGHEICVAGKGYWVTRFQQPVVIVADLEDCGPR